MKVHTPYLRFNAKKKREFINVTAELEKALGIADIQERLVPSSTMHITAGVYVNDAEGRLIANIGQWLEQLALIRADYHHHRTRWEPTPVRI